MNIFLYSLKRLLKNKISLVMMLILPMAALMPILLSNSPDEPVMRIGFVDEDQTELTSIIVKKLSTKFQTSEVKESDLKTRLMNSEIEYGLVFEKGFTSMILEGKRVQVKGYLSRESVLFGEIRKNINEFMDSIYTIAKASNYDRKQFYRYLETYNSGIYTLQYENIGPKNLGRSNSLFGLLIQFMLFFSAFSATLILNDKENMTFYRTLSAPVGIRSYMMQSILSFLVLSVIQGMMFSTIFVVGFGIYPGSSILNMYLFLSVFSIVSVALGVAVSSLCKNTTQASIAGLSLVIFISMIGGLWWPLDTVPEGIRTVAKFVPVYWATEGVKKILNDAALLEVSGEMGMMLLFSLVFLLFGTWRKEDVAH